MEEQNNNIPKKRNNPFEKIVKENAETIEKKVEKTKKNSTTKETKKTSTNDKSEITKKTPSKVSTSKGKSTTKTTATKNNSKNKVNISHITSTKIDPRTGLVKTSKSKPVKEVKTIVEEIQPVVTKKTIKKKTTKKIPVITIEPPARSNEPEVIVRPTPKKTKQWTKEEKLLYKKLEESFSTVANMAMVIEERTMDTKNIPNLTIGEVHLIEMVNRYNNKPMTLIANKMHITVGAMTICLNRLVQKGYLLRTRDEMDRRVILLSVTPDGKKILKFHNKFHDDILGIVLDTIPIAQATKVMSQFAYVLEYYFDPSIAQIEDKKTSKREKK